MFGKDVNYGGFDGMRELSRLAPDPAGGQAAFERSSVFLDGGIVLPTASGLPLAVSVNGTYNVEFR